MRLVSLRKLTLLAATAVFMATGPGLQVASAEDITVLVLEEISPSTTVPVPGATVTLRGTDPSSSGGLVLTTGAGGTVTFTGVTGPYSVTAQKDSVVGGETIRSASSLVDIAPVLSGSAGTIGVLFEAADDPGVPTFGTLSGTIANPPTLSGTEIVEVVAFDRVEGYAAGTIAFGGTYSMSLPAGVVVDIYVAHRTDFGSSPVLASLVATGLGPVGTGGALVQNFNFANAVPWSTTVNVSESGRNPNLTGIGIQLELLTSAGVEIDFSFFDGLSAPSTILLPDVTDPAFAAFNVDLSSDAYDPLDIFPADQDRGFRLTSTPASVTFDFMPVPALVQPSSGSVLSPSELSALNVSFTLGMPPSGFGTNGINGFFLESESGGGAPPGIDAAQWNILVPGAIQSFDMPPHALPMVSTGQVVFAGVFQERFQGLTLTYETFFDANLAANLAALDSSVTEGVSGESYIGLLIDSDSYCTAGVSASGCQATLSSIGTPSANAPSGFTVGAASVEGDTRGLFFFGWNGRQANPWGNGTSFQCVQPPVKRAGLQNKAGTSGLCDGSFSQDLNAYWTLKPNKNPGAGAIVQTQFWYRDPQNTSNQTTSLSDAIEFTVSP